MRYLLLCLILISNSFCLVRFGIDPEEDAKKKLMADMVSSSTTQQPTTSGSGTTTTPTDETQTDNNTTPSTPISKCVDSSMNIDPNSIDCSTQSSPVHFINFSSDNKTLVATSFAMCILGENNGYFFAYLDTYMYSSFDYSSYTPISANSENFSLISLAKNQNQNSYISVASQSFDLSTLDDLEFIEVNSYLSLSSIKQSNSMEMVTSRSFCP